MLRSGTLMAVINRGIEKVNARAQSRDDGLDVGLVGGIIRLAEICTEPNGREPEIADAGYLFRAAEVAGSAQLRKAIGVTFRALSRGVPFGHRLSV